MAEVKVTINGAQTSGREGVTILELAQENGIKIPTLCYLAELSPTGACRICIVEVEGSRTLVGSCHTPITPGMIIQTHSPKVLATRKVIIELLFASHCGFCMLCNKANVCNLRELAADLDVGLSPFQTRKRFYPIEDNPYIQIDRTQCILCRKCVRACREIAGNGILGIAYRSFDTKIVIDNDQPLAQDTCRDCDICISVCPTGCLSKPKKLSATKTEKPLIIC
ncbi:MAG: 2Fe-2S iron-sulfur cluster-binding protein [Dehalococcoidales bacterium]|jgi:NADH dehydrogenase/NADH:ubiquinone oxidoreductase subunit G|nr:2Fe-2S iron-sulfur cluster-binding protein [Dehalococcoidales bacterium]MDP7109447.1 2Fe-2S iron-sulfur cluster-binding protein [Dehalococcoidales bacterium]MDP7309841.1 2Fe-2S iron-sulfur cluster-binding protein [Dehalococcoidales bacterium]MDP7409753.1 2Fe-2S iron-sulfur cluster-binding protein [Dehalococcoidales bacterium]MDP7676152.1 2Fe-2S iron-sulfur cluster-binding protein [Dehalococcoidales bacterium]|tara:strand:- start:517 stop:1188 length:672 start_codon:yes stop_codon:yes gene_type:complete